MILRPDVRNPFNKNAVYYVESTASTMEIARQLVQKKCQTGTVIWAGFQTKGRGRFPDRKWVSEPGQNLLFSIILGKDAVGYSAALVPLLAGLAVSDAILKLYKLRCEVKWPNDVLFGRKKLSGILCESYNNYFIIGIGINCNQKNFPEGQNFPVTSISAATGTEVLLGSLLAGVLFEVYNLEQCSDPLASLSGRLYLNGEKIVVDRGIPGMTPPVSGIFRGIGENGEMLLENEGKGEIIKIYSGEIRG